MSQHQDVMISSTIIDLEEHRKQALDAVLRVGMHPLMMEHQPSSGNEAITFSLALVDKAEVYLGIYAFRYGYVPDGHDISLTEMEYNYAKERGIPRVIMIMDDDHPIKRSEMDTGEKAEKLEAFKARVRLENFVHTFKSPAELRSEIISDLAQHRTSDAVSAIHYVSDIPQPPDKYIAHPYTLLSSRDLVGRREELSTLTDWIAKPNSATYNARIMSVVAIGGMGKSALTWKWFEEVAPNEAQWSGRMWWSFYESDASFENFVIRTLAYVSRRSIEDVRKLPPPERENQLFNALNKEPFLIVMDGLERILTAYARMDAARLADDDFDQQTANFVAGAIGLPPEAGQSFIGQHKLRRTSDPRAGMFLRKLAQIQKSRILISTRLYPSDLQSATGAPISGCSAIFLRGMRDDDALELWRRSGVSGSRDALIRLFRKFDNYPLLIRALAGEVANYKRAPGDFDEWQSRNPNFTPKLESLKHEDRKAHILYYAMQGLTANESNVLHTIAAFRMPASYETLVSLSVGDEKLFASEHELDDALVGLEERGLVGWDRRANRYDLHPIVRGVVWNALKDDDRKAVYASMQGHFQSMPSVREWQKVESFEDITPAVELYNTLIGLGRYEDAYMVFRERWNEATLYRLNAMLQRIELLEMLFPEGVDNLPRLENPARQGVTLNALAMAYKMSGQVQKAVGIYRRHNEVQETRDDPRSLAIGLCNYADALRFAGALYDSEEALRRALSVSTDADRISEALYYLAIVLASRGEKEMSTLAITRSLHMAAQRGLYYPADYRALHADLVGDVEALVEWGEKALDYCENLRFERGVVRSMRLIGVGKMEQGDLRAAEDLLNRTLERVRTINLVEEELPVLIGLAEMYRRVGKLDVSRERLSEVWELAERGPFPSFMADAYNVLASLEYDEGKHEAALDAAENAYKFAWGDGISHDGKINYVYWRGLEKAKEHLRLLRAPVPGMPPSDIYQRETMPTVDMNPEDEFYIDPVTLQPKPPTVSTDDEMDEDDPFSN
jgi:tetratricopeptide (TPR) repeat protein